MNELKICILYVCSVFDTGSATWQRDCRERQSEGVGKLGHSSNATQLVVRFSINLLRRRPGFSLWLVAARLATKDCT